MPHPRTQAKKLLEVPPIACSGLCCIQTDDAIETICVPSEPASARPMSEVQFTPRMPLAPEPVLLDELLAFELRLQSSIALTMQEQYEKLSSDVLDVLGCSRQPTPFGTANMSHAPVVFAQTEEDSARNWIQMEGKNIGSKAMDGVRPLVELGKSTEPDPPSPMLGAKKSDCKAYGENRTESGVELARGTSSRKSRGRKSSSTNVKEETVLADLLQAENMRPRAKKVEANMKYKFESQKTQRNSSIDELIYLSWGARILQHPFFDSLCALAIVFNAILIGVSVEWLTTHKEETALLILLGYLCSLFFLLELMLRLHVHHLSYFKNEDWAWNSFDFALVVFSVADFLIWLIFGSSGAGSVGSALKIVKMLRIVRIVRVFRFFRELSLLALLIMDSLRSLVWTLLMLMIIIYTFAIGFTQNASEFLKSFDENDMSPKDREIVDRFGSLPKTICSLVYAMLGGVSWGEISDPLIHMDAFSAMLFFFYICLTLLAVLNIITGVFVDNAVETAKVERAFLVQKEMELREKLLAEMRQLFAEMDKDGSGSVSFKELNEYLNDERVETYFRALGIDTTDAERLFSLVDTDDSGEVQVAEFLDGCLRLKGEARSIDVNTILWQCRQIQARLDKLGGNSNGIHLPEQVGMDKVPSPNAEGRDRQAATPLFRASETRQA